MVLNCGCGHGCGSAANVKTVVKCGWYNWNYDCDVAKIVVVMLLPIVQNIWYCNCNHGNRLQFKIILKILMTIDDFS